MKSTSLLLGVAALPAIASAFTVGPSSPSTSLSTSSTSLPMAKGFDANAKPQKKQKSEGQLKRERMGNQYDEIAAAGGQEYAIFVRQFGGEDESWLPCGSIAVPRGAQVSDAIFENEDDLKVAIVRTFPKLKGFEQEFEYGYNLKVYPDDPVEVAKKNAPKGGAFSLGGWMSNLLSPIDASQAKN